MLVKTRGIVLHTLPYGENSLIVSLYTIDYGRISCLVNSARGAKSGNKSSLLQPLFIVEIELYLKKNRELQRMKEIRLFHPFRSIPFRIIKSTQVLFLAEMLYKIIREEESNPGLYSFLENALIFFDEMEEGSAGFHLWFLARLTEFAGIHPYLENDENGWFDLKKGVITRNEPLHPHYMDRETTSLFREIINCHISELQTLSLNNKMRNVLINKIMEYYHLHFENLGNFNSLVVLHEVFQG